MSGTEKQFQIGFLRDMVRYYKAKYGPGQPFQLPQEMLDVFEWVVEESNDINLWHAFWFMSMYLNPGLYNWFMNGDVATSAPPPPLTDKKRFADFIGSILPPLCEELLSGNRGMNINSFVRLVRTEYVVNNFLPMPDASLRKQNVNIKEEKEEEEDY